MAQVQSLVGELRSQMVQQKINKQKGKSAMLCIFVVVVIVVVVLVARWKIWRDGEAYLQSCK